MGRKFSVGGEVLAEVELEAEAEVEVEVEVKVEGGTRRMTRELEIDTVRRRNVLSVVQRTASSEGRPLIVSLVQVSKGIIDVGVPELAREGFRRGTNGNGEDDEDDSTRLRISDGSSRS